MSVPATGRRCNLGVRRGGGGSVEDVVDCHTHLLPSPLDERVRQRFGSASRSLAYPLDHGALRERLAAEGVSEIWTLPYAHRPGVAEWLNETTAAISSQPGPLRVVGGATVHPGDDDPAGIVRRAVEDLGLRVLKLHSSVGAFDVDDLRLAGVWEFVAGAGVPVVVHAGHSPAGTTEAAELGPIDTVASHHPEAAIIVAHCGHPAVEATLDLLSRHRRLYADLTPVVSRVPALPLDRIHRLRRQILFGSDAPNVAVRLTDHLRSLRASIVDDDLLAMVLRGNARALVPAAGES